MDTRSVIVAVASPPGAALRGLVRLSGADCCAVVRAVAAWGDTEGQHNPWSRGAYRAALRSVGAPATTPRLPPCPCMLLVMPGPASATGEDCAELHLPGNPHLLERVAQACVHAGTAAGALVRRAGPGEFSTRAVLNGRTTLADAERVAMRVAAVTDAQLAAAEALRANAAGQAAAHAADALATLLALVEAGIDFTDQEGVQAIAPARLAEELRRLCATLEAQLAQEAAREAALDAPLVVLAGAPNAGKSSLFNALLGRPRAVASPEAGTTRDELREPLPLPDGTTALLTDIPGLCQPHEALDALMQAQAERALAAADLVVWCTPADAASAAGAPGASRTPNATAPSAAAAPTTPTLHVHTKCDLAPAPSPCTSARTGHGLAELRAAIAAALAARHTQTGHARAVLGAAHRALLAEAVQALRDAAEATQPELQAAAMRTALDRLGEVAGQIPPDDVLGRLFSRFCVGK